MINCLFNNDIVRSLVRMLIGFIVFRDNKFKSLVKQLSAEGKILLGFRDMWNLYNSVKRTKNVSGDIAELGVYSGGSAKLICEAKNGKSLYLFDTFSGLPSNVFGINKINSGMIRGGVLSEVKDYLKKYNDVYFYEGVFPASAIELNNSTYSFSLVHLDADIYEATLDGLKFFYPLMSKNGIILVHDYYNVLLPGVKRAVDEFLIDKSEINIASRYRVLNQFYPADQAIIIKE